MKILALLSLLCVLSGCEWIGNTADNIGNHLPVIGERCDYWQCFTEKGKARSQYKRAIREGQDPNELENPFLEETPEPATPSQNTPATPPAYPSVSGGRPGAP